MPTNKFFEDLQNTRGQFLKLISKLNEEQLQYTPAPGKWSIYNVIDHLATAEQVSLNYMIKKVQGVEDLKPEKLKSGFNYLKLVVFFNSSFKWKVPKGVLKEVHMKNDGTALDLWEGVRKDLSDFILSNTKEDLEKNIFRHPLAGRMNLKDTLKFMALHIRHHMKQVERISREGGFEDKLIRQ